MLAVSNKKMGEFVKIKTEQFSIVARILLASVLIGALVLYFLTQLLPGASLLLLACYALVGLLALAVSLLGVILITSTFRQWILRSGGTDTQWLWFSEDPPGLLALRDKQRATVFAKRDLT